MRTSRLGRPGVTSAAALLSVAVSLAGGCKRPPAQFVPPPPPEVTVAEPAVRSVEVSQEYTGVVRGVEEVEVRARVRGFLQKKLVQDGRRVRAGDELFVIDPRTFKAALAQAEAERLARQADERLAVVTLERLEGAMATNAVSKLEVDRARAQLDAAKAQVQLADARVRAAELELEFTTVKAPISGRVGFVPVEVGDLVGAVEPTLLARIINDEKVYATYDMDERTVLESRRANQNRRPGEDGRPNVTVKLAMLDDAGFPHEGVFDRADNAVNPATGTIRVESLFDNPNGTILPGAYVRVKPVYGEKQVLTVPDVAVQSDQRGRFVMVVNKDNKAERREVKVGEAVDRQRVIIDGLEPTSRVIVNGLQRVRPGMEVRPVLASAPGAGGTKPASGEGKK